MMIVMYVVGQIKINVRNVNKIIFRIKKLPSPTSFGLIKTDICSKDFYSPFKNKI